jgi:predicted outer membrane repeat protein
MGGAIWFQLAAVNVKDSLFKANSAINQGGAFYQYCSAAAISTTAFVGNNVHASDIYGGGGGALYVNSDMNSVKLREVSFLSNNATNNKGDAIMFYFDSIISQTSLHL